MWFKGTGMKAPTGWSPERGCAPPNNFFCIFSFELVHFDAFWSTNLHKLQLTL